VRVGDHRLAPGPRDLADLVPELVDEADDEVRLRREVAVEGADPDAGLLAEAYAAISTEER